MSKDTIYREDAIKVVSHVAMECVDRKTRIELINAIPSADRPSGEWIRTFDGNEWFWYCSNCKTQWYEDDLWMGGNEFPTFCPQCGARMKGADDE